MPNGKFGDHPVTDIVVHKRSVFSREIDNLIQRIASIEGVQKLDKRLNWFALPPKEELKKELSRILEELEKQEKS
jgi:hypothetical protein